MSEETTTSTGTDPLKAVADALDAAVLAAKEGAEKARATADEVLPAAGQMLSTTVYKTSYAISYGVVFASVFLARSIPQNNAVVHGLVDGARAAVDLVNDMKAKPASAETH